MPYSGFGVKIPYFDPGPGKEWSEDDHIQKDGFLLVEITNAGVFVVQSLGDWKLYLNNILRKGERQSYGGPHPAELKASTFWDVPGNDGNGDDDDDDDDDEYEGDDSMDTDDPSEYAPADDDSYDELWEQMAETRIRGGAGEEGGDVGEEEVEEEGEEEREEEGDKDPEQGK